MAKILIVNSSARKESNSRILAAKVAEGAAGNGHTVKTIEIGKMPIQPCIGCESCQKKPGNCVLKDELTGFYQDIIEADILILSSPIYFFAMNGQMKTFIDRIYPIMSSFKGKKIGAVFSYGDVDPVKSGCVNAIRILQDICGSELIEAIWVGAVYGSLLEKGAAAESPELLKLAEDYGASL